MHFEAKNMMKFYPLLIEFIVLDSEHKLMFAQSDSFSGDICAFF